MKRKLYFVILAAITAAAVITGVMHHFSSIPKLSWNFESNDFYITLEPRGTEHIHQDLESFSSAQITVENTGVELQTGENYTVSFTGSKKAEPHISAENGVLTIKGSDKDSGGYIVLTVPKDAAGDISYSITTDNGEIQISGTSNEMNAITQNGDILVDDYTGNALTACTENGDISLDTCRGKNLSVRTKNGDISLDGCSGTTLTAYSANGDISRDSCSFETESVISENGDVLKDN